MKTLIIDNYDSFTYNLVEYIKQCGITDYDVFRNDKISMEECAAYDQIIISPGPGVPIEAGIVNEMIKELAPSKKILGICLGMQAMGEVFGCKLTNLETVYHGEATPIQRTKEDDPIFKNIPEKLIVGRYHSWGIHEKNMSADFTILAKDSEDIIMAIRHKKHNLTGLQFHPESVLTENGMQMIANWLSVPEPELNLVFPAANSTAFDINKIERSLFF